MATIQRDVYNPLLFEIAWEVANKGKFLGKRKRETRMCADEYACHSTMYV